MRYLIDTHVLVWWRSGSNRLVEAYVTAMEDELAQGRTLGLSAISLWELAKLVEKKRVRLPAAIDLVLAQIETDPGFEVLPLDARIAAESTRLGRAFPRDPADQIIGATARCHSLTLVTADDRIRASGAVAVL